MFLFFGFNFNLNSLREIFSASGRTDRLQGSLSLKITSPRRKQEENKADNSPPPTAQGRMRGAITLLLHTSS
jgi:hypothetical protein